MEDRLIYDYGAILINNGLRNDILCSKRIAVFQISSAYTIIGMSQKRVGTIFTVSADESHKPGRTKVTSDIRMVQYDTQAVNELIRRRTFSLGISRKKSVSRAEKTRKYDMKRNQKYDAE
jgi:hypothetical protein